MPFQDEAPADRAKPVGTGAMPPARSTSSSAASASSRSEPYDEDGLARGLEFGDGVVVPGGLAGPYADEAIVAAFKTLLRAGPAGPGAKVAFVRLACSAAPALPLLRIVFSRRLGAFCQGDIEASRQRRAHPFREWR